ncbi:hypothetical protein [Flavobacterium sp. KACC 22763]|uniref:hypothetical protein n=1 Tax=Flavobacterium sp. KACC 22763 TaxID=3025668 RepID=UPI002366DDA5|nr:hypothetical protein [Flavobacterium sp. KACC 22763]WDF65931.1 hypothetical protein PQ463_07110 [Flavobacterium sp. KACC 22763]
MNYYREINTARNIMVSKLSETDENCLEFNLIIGKVSDIKNDINHLLDVNEIIFDDNNLQFLITFDNYISYSVLNESYENLGGEIYHGEKIRIYSSSNFLDYLKKETFATSDYPGEFKHYAFITSRHIINVASLEEPIIEKL